MLGQENIRNFVIISHINHGKSTLTDRFLEITGTVPKEKMQPQFLDMLALERERGITIKLQPARMLYKYSSEIEYILNLIDTPGHVDFSYEVSRCLAAVEGAILLVDTSKGIQAQTLHHLSEAKKQGLTIIPAINKVDLPQADVSKTKKELQGLLGENQVILEISAKFGTNVEKLLEEVIKQVPSPRGKAEAPLRALIFGSQYDSYKGVIAFVRIVDGKIKAGQELYLLEKKVQGIAKEIGYFRPKMLACQELKTGEIGYIATGIKEPSKVRVGDTITSLKFLIPKELQTAARPVCKVQGLKLPEPLPGYQMPRPVLFASIYPKDPNEFSKLQKSLYQLQLIDPALNFELESKTVLGQGFRCSFLGNLHAEIIIERLKRDFNLDLLVSRPQVVYKITGAEGEPYFISSARDFPENLQGKRVQERWVILEILTPQNFLGPVLVLLENLEGRYLETRYLGENRLILTYETPLREFMAGFYDKLKSVSQGFASLNYEIGEWREADLVKLEILIAGKKEELFSQIVPKDRTFEQGKRAVKKLKLVLPRQQFALALQAKVGGKIIARETISAKRKDVIAPLYGGDYTRKRKLLEKQKKGKKKLKEKGAIRIPPEVFLKMLKD